MFVNHCKTQSLKEESNRRGNYEVRGSSAKNLVKSRLFLLKTQQSIAHGIFRLDRRNHPDDKRSVHVLTSGH